MKRCKPVILFVFLLAFASFGNVQAQDKPRFEPQPLDTQYIYCTVCHGADFKGNINTFAPNLRGLNAWYIERQLLAFKSGLRGTHSEDLNGQQMKTMAVPLSISQAREVAALISQLPAMVPASTISGDVARGKKIFAACAACHGENAEGNSVIGGPALGFLDDWYIKAQLLNFKNGLRGTQAGDTRGAQMLAPVSVLKSEEDINNVVAYISQIASTKKSTPLNVNQTNTKEAQSMKKSIIASSLLALSATAAAEVTRYPLPNNSTFPIARAVEVSSDTTLIFHSGQVPGPAKPDAKKGSAEYYGDTEAQAMNVFKQFEDSFKDLGVGFGDVVKMTVFIVGDPAKGGEMDFSGFMRAYTKFFGTKEQPNLPARSAFQIAGLAGGPNMLIEIEMVIAKPPAKSMAEKNEK